MTELHAEEYAILKNALAAALEVRSLLQRRALIRDPFGGNQYQREIETALRRVSWSDSPEPLAGEIIHKLKTHAASEGLPALAVVAHAAEVATEPEYRAAVAALRARKGWPDVDVSRWQDSRPTPEIAERMIGKDNLKPMYYLRQALRAADAVVRVDVNHQSMGTGFLIAPDLVMTCNHVIGNEADAHSATFLFYYEDHDPRTEEARARITVYPATTNFRFYTNADKTLDFTVVRVRGVPAEIRWLRLKPLPLKQNDQVVIIQHPDSRPKEICMQNNLVASADGKLVQYYTSTSGGSSGAPVFDNGFSVVAIHRASVGDDEAPKTWRNRGTSMIAVLEDLKQNAPDLFQEIVASES